MIIDSVSSENVVSKALARALELLTEPHPKPYKIGWIKKGIETKVNKLCRVPFSTGNHYQDLLYVMWWKWMLAMFWWTLAI